jgi:regulator of protease activity HflC (stomatin/prohibitin superfamily)
MIGYLGSLQKRSEANYDTQILRAQAQREAKELREEQDKYDRQKKMQDSIVKHREETVETTNVSVSDVCRLFSFCVR